MHKQNDIREIIYTLIFFVIIGTYPYILYSGYGAGLSLEFDGDDDYAKISNPLDFNSFTIEFWIIVHTRDGGQQDPISKFGSNDWWQIRIDGGRGAQFSTNVPAEKTCNFQASQLVLKLDVWEHWCATIDVPGNLITTYVNGKQYLTAAGVNVYANDTTDIYFGEIFTGSHLFHFDGELDQVRIWDYVRSASQVDSWYAKPIPGEYPGLEMNYHFDESVGGLVDKSGNGHHSVILSGTRRVKSGAPIK